MKALVSRKERRKRRSSLTGKVISSLRGDAMMVAMVIGREELLENDGIQKLVDYPYKDFPRQEGGSA